MTNIVSVAQPGPLCCSQRVPNPLALQGQGGCESTRMGKLFFKEAQNVTSKLGVSCSCSVSSLLYRKITLVRTSCIQMTLCLE